MVRLYLSEIIFLEVSMIPIFGGYDPMLLTFLKKAFSSIPKVRALDWDDTLWVWSESKRKRVFREKLFGVPVKEYLQTYPYLIHTWTMPTEYVMECFEKHPELPPPVCIIAACGFPDYKDLSLLPLPAGSEVIDDLPVDKIILPPGTTFYQIAEQEEE